MTDKEKDLIKKFAIYASREDANKAKVHYVSKPAIADFHYIYNENEYVDIEKYTLLGYLMHKPSLIAALDRLYNYYCGEAETEGIDIQIAARKARQEVRAFEKKGHLILSRIATVRKFDVVDIKLVNKAINDTKIILQKLEDAKKNIINSDIVNKQIIELENKKAVIDAEINRLKEIEKQQ